MSIGRRQAAFFTIQLRKSSRTPSQSCSRTDTSHSIERAFTAKSFRSVGSHDTRTDARYRRRLHAGVSGHQGGSLTARRPWRRVLERLRETEGLPTAIASNNGAGFAGRTLEGFLESRTGWKRSRGARQRLRRDTRARSPRLAMPRRRKYWQISVLAQCGPPCSPLPRRRSHTSAERRINGRRACG